MKMQNPETARDKIPSLRDLLTVVFKHKLGTFVLFAIIVCLVTVLTYVRPFTYEATSKVLIKFERDEVPLTSSAAGGRPILTMRSAEEDIRTEMEILKNKYLLEAVLERLSDDLSQVAEPQPTSIWSRLRHQIAETMGVTWDFVLRIGYNVGLLKELTPMEAKLQELEQNLRVESVGDSNVIEISYQSSRPEICSRVVNCLTELYMEQHIKVHKTPRAHDFFAEQRALWEKRLKEQEEALKSFRETWSISSIELERGLLLDNISDSMMQQDRLQGEIEDAEKRRNKIQEQMTSRTNYKESDQVSPAVLNVDTVYRNLDNERLMTESKLSGLLASSQLYEQHLKAYRDRLAVLDEKETELQRMTRELAILEDNYKTYCKKLEETRISEALDLERISNVTVIEPAITPFEPVRVIPFLPTRVFHILVGILVGLVVSVGYAFLTEQMNHTFGAREDVEKILKIPCLVSIPKE